MKKVVFMSEAINYDFTLNEVTTKSLANRKLVFGVGTNDSKYLTHSLVNSKRVVCPFYRKWKSMLERCYSDTRQEKSPTYKGCSVAEDWLLFSNFRGWMITQEYIGLHLDKDIKVKGNKIYSAETCLFIPPALNKLLLNRAAKRGLYPIGVYFSEKDKVFRAGIKHNSKTKYLGSFKTSSEASIAYQKAREAKIKYLIDEDVYPIATKYLKQHV